MDEHDFTAIYAEVYPSVEAATRRVIADRSVAQEVVQDVLLEIWRTWDGARPTTAAGGARAWASVIARRRAIDRLRSERARRDREDRFGRAACLDQGDPVSEEVLVRLDAAAVRLALGGLGLAKRESVVLAYFGGNSYRAVAGLLSLPDGTVKRRIRDGLRSLAASVGPAHSISDAEADSGAGDRSSARARCSAASSGRPTAS